ncbi:MAG: TPM domain-containing protein [Pyrinomonadaceae bacterium]
MKKLWLPVAPLLFLVVTILHVTASYSVAQSPEPFNINTSPLPAPTGFVNDYAGVIDATAKEKIESRLREFKEKSNPPTELAVAVVKTTGDRPIFDYSLAVSRGWGIGSKADDNPSALLLIAIEDRKYFTQVSKDLEDELPDGIVGSLQRQFLVPEFRKGDYSKGVSDTIDAYIRTIESRRSGTEPTATPSPKSGQRSQQSLFSVFCCLMVLLVLLLVILSSRKKSGPNDKDRWGGGGFGGGGGVLPWIILGGGSGGGSSSSSWGGSSDWGGSSGGWGGFGGGGDFGGGGGGGDW